MALYALFAIAFLLQAIEALAADVTIVPIFD